MSAAIDTLRSESVFRVMRASDIHQITRIENASYSFPWSGLNFRDCLRFNYICNVIDCGGQIAAYSVCQIASPELHILNLCVDPDLRRRGFARMMLAFIQDMATAQKIRYVYLEVRPSNLEAVGLYLSEGFVKVGCRPAYYPDLNGREDASLMSKWLGN